MWTADTEAGASVACGQQVEKSKDTNFRTTIEEAMTAAKVGPIRVSQPPRPT